MATAYTGLSENATDGERRFYLKLKANLPDEFMVWQGVEVEDKKGRKREIDFIVFHPVYGVWVVEVKDWRAEQILSVEQYQWQIIEKGEQKIRKSPFAQVRENKYVVKEALERHGELIHSRGVHEGKLKVPIHSIGVFTNISKEDLMGETRKNLRDVITSQKAWLRDLLDDPLADDEQWRKEILRSRDVKFQSDLSLPEIEVVKCVFGVPVVFAASGESIGTLDAHQRRLVEADTDTDLVIEGPAGSGKSIVLVKRAMHLAKEHPDWLIGIMCYNALMGSHLRSLIKRDSGKEDTLSRIEIYDVFQWVRKWLPSVTLLYSQVEDPREAIGQALKAETMNPRYDALLVDEGQDADDNLLHLYRMCLKPTGHLTYFYDNRQVLYTDKSVVEMLEDFGFAVSKEKKLVKQQRSVLILLALGFFERMKYPAAPSKEIIAKVLSLGERMFFDARNLLLGMVTGLARLFGKGREKIDWQKEVNNRIHLVRTDSVAEAVSGIVDRIAIETKNQGISKEYLILFPKRKLKEKVGEVDLASLVREKLREKRIPYIYIDKRNGEQYNGTKTLPQGDNRRKVDTGINVVKVMTIHTAKGLDADQVLILGFDVLEEAFADKMAELGYVALTRAKQEVYVYYQNEMARPIQALLEVKKTIQNRG